MQAFVGPSNEKKILFAVWFSLFVLAFLFVLFCFCGFLFLFLVEATVVPPGASSEVTL